MDNLVSLDALVSLIPNHASLAVPSDRSGVAMAATLALIARGRATLHLICGPTRWSAPKRRWCARDARITCAC